MANRCRRLLQETEGGATVEYILLSAAIAIGTACALSSALTVVNAKAIAIGTSLGASAECGSRPRKVDTTLPIRRCAEPSADPHPSAR